MKYLLLALLPACAHISSHPVTGSAGRQRSASTVACVDLSPTDCLQVREAVGYLNAAFGDVLLVWVPGSSALIPVAYGSSFDPAWSAESYAVTVYQVYLESGYFARRTITVFAAEDAMSVASRQTMFRHELAHALGLPHNEWDRTSLMFPRGESDAMEPKPLNEADLRALTSIYTRDFGF